MKTKYYVGNSNDLFGNSGEQRFDELAIAEAYQNNVKVDIFNMFSEDFKNLDDVDFNDIRNFIIAIDKAVYLREVDYEVE